MASETEHKIVIIEVFGVFEHSDYAGFKAIFSSCLYQLARKMDLSQKMLMMNTAPKLRGISEYSVGDRRTLRVLYVPTGLDLSSKF